MNRAGFGFTPASGLPTPRAHRRRRAALIAVIVLLIGLLALSEARAGGAPSLGWGAARGALAVLVLALFAVPLVRRASAAARRGQLARDALALSAAVLAFLVGALELWMTAPGAHPPAALASLGLRPAAWAAARPLGFELAAVIAALALGIRHACAAARLRAADDARAGAVGEPALDEIRRAIAFSEHPAALPRALFAGACGPLAADEPGCASSPAGRAGCALEPPDDLLEVAARALCIAAPAFAALAFVAHAAAGGPLSPAALLAPVAVLAGCSPAAFWRAAPVARALAIARAGAAGAVVRDPRALEPLACADAVCFEKGGTLTIGRPRVMALAWVRPPDRALLEEVLALEQRSAHPAGRAVAAFLAAAGVRPAEAGESLDPEPLREDRAGIVGRVRGRLLEVSAPPRRTPLDGGPDARHLDPSASISWFHRDGEPFGYFELYDPPREGAAAAVLALRERGLVPRILSADRHEAVRALGLHLGAPGFGGLCASGKALHVRDLQRAGARVLFVGSADGAAAAQADAAVTLSPDAAAPPGPIALTAGRIAPLPYLVDLSRALRARLREGLAVATLYNALLIPCAVIGWIPPAAAAALAFVEALAVLANALRLPHPSSTQGPAPHGLRVHGQGTTLGDPRVDLNVRGSGALRPEPRAQPRLPGPARAR
ncbi:MAG: cation-translocating P-type ATPase [Polyangiaceae bacterium]|nr:cation-translocating P-type ATPase [Polyangiaceae bacterium]